MEVFDVSVPIRERMPTYSGNPGIRIERAQEHVVGSDGAPARALLVRD